MDVRRQIVVGMVSLAVLYGSSAQALGLGEIRLDSALHQPLNASIVLHGTDGLSPDDIIVSLADASEFSKVGVDRTHFLTLLRFTPVLQGNNLVVQVQSSAPVVEPYLNFLIQLKRPHGTLLREYTVLLDPPLYQPASITSAATAAVAQTDAAVPRRVRSPAPQPLELPQLQADPKAERYQSQSGDSLWTIAKTTRADDSVPVRRQMLAIRALNPEAFVNGDMDRLRAGQALTLPTADQVGVPVAALVAAAPAMQLPAAEPAVDSGSVAAAGRLRIAEQVDAPFPEIAEYQQRLDTLESRFTELLAELDSRDRQIASLQVELELLREARDAEQGSTVATGAGEELLQSDIGSAVQQSQPDSYAPVAGGLASELSQLSGLTEVASESPPFSMMNWWPALLALLAAVAGLIIVRLRRQGEDSPQPIEAFAETVPAIKRQDVVEGAEMYLAYGRYAEARSLLDKAILAEPQRLDLRLRQLAALAQLGDSTAFAEQEQQVQQLGGNAAQLAQLRALLAASITPSVAEPIKGAKPFAQPEPVSKNEAESFQADLLGQDDFSLDPDWSLLDDLNPSGSRRQTRAVDGQRDETFETNLNDFPEVGELDDELSQHFTDSTRKPSDS